MTNTTEHSTESDRHCHADGAGPCLADDCPIAGMGPLRGHLRPCPGAQGPQHPARVRGRPVGADPMSEHTAENDAHGIIYIDAPLPATVLNEAYRMHDAWEREHTAENDAARVNPYLRIEDTTWPDPADPNETAWRLLYGQPSKKDLMFAVSVMNAYGYLFEMSQRDRNRRMEQIKARVIPPGTTCSCGSKPIGVVDYRCPVHGAPKHRVIPPGVGA